MKKAKEVRIKIIDGGLPPEFKTEGAACADGYARLLKRKIVWLKPTLIPLGFAAELPADWELLVRGRSGFSKKGRFVTLGTVDSDFRGEISACVWSLLPFVVNNGDRIAQCAVREAPKITFVKVDELSETERGDGGFGHTGLK